MHRLFIGSIFAVLIVSPADARKGPAAGPDAERERIAAKCRAILRETHPSGQFGAGHRGYTVRFMDDCIRRGGKRN